MEEENKLAFLDVMVIRNTNETINVTVYQKPTNIFTLTGIHIQHYSGRKPQLLNSKGN